MPVRISVAARNAACDGIVDLIDGGSGSGVLRVYSGAQPATPATAPSGTLLAEFTLTDPAFGDAVAGVATLDVSPALTDAGITDGSAGWARFCDSTQAAGTGLGIIDGTVATSGGMVTVNTVAVTTGVAVEVTAGTVTVPSS